MRGQFILANTGDYHKFTSVRLRTLTLFKQLLTKFKQRIEHQIAFKTVSGIH